MATRKFDKSAAFKSILGVAQIEEAVAPKAEPVVAAVENTARESEAASAKPGGAPLVMKPHRHEPRDQRRQIVLTRSLAAKVKGKQKTLGLSFNEVVTQLLQVWVDQAE